jgi:hypothetical protein
VQRRDRNQYGGGLLTYLYQIWLSIQQKTIFREWKNLNSVSWSIYKWQ